MRGMRIAMAVSFLGGTAALGLAQQSDRIVVVLPQDAIPSIDRPEFEAVLKAKSFNNDELLIGIVGEHEQRAYSTWQLDRHEIVNDTFEGRAIAVTWCPLCGTGIVYARAVGARTLTFGVSGMLYRDALVMFDRETGTLWSQIDGRAIRGPLAGQVLQPLASVHATWKEWKTLYPDSLALRKHGQSRSSYEDYNREPSRLGIFGRRMKGSALPPKERILGIRYNGATTAFALKGVRQAVIVEAEVGGVPVVLAALGSNLPVVAFERRVQGRALHFARADAAEPALEDAETHSRWRASDGEAIDGPLKGERLTRVAAYPAFWFGWYGFFPESAVWRPSR